MSETKHTPAPWVTEASTKTGNLRFIRAEDGTLVADVFHLNSTRETTTANAHLIAAAPELLSALRECMRMVSDGELIVANEHWGPLKAVAGAAHTAIAKAEGR